MLVVKMSSMGDVVHALPAISDMHRHLPGVRVDWLVEAAFAALPALHPGVERVIPLSWRKWRRALGRGDTWRAIGQLRAALRAEPYDLVLDLQGLVKSVLWGLQARGPLAGYDASSVREPVASWFYARKAAVSRQWHAVDRCRALAAASLGYALPADRPDFGIVAPTLSWAPEGPFAVLIPSASRDEKLWPEADWIAIGQRLRDQGWLPVVLWGGAAEQARAQHIADGCGGAVPPFLSVRDAAAMLGHASVVVGLDTGFSHVAAAFGVPTLGIYCDHEPGLAGITGPGWVRSIGGKAQRPSLTDVMSLVEAQIAYWSSAQVGGNVSQPRHPGHCQNQC